MNHHKQKIRLRQTDLCEFNDLPSILGQDD